jgi:hypothetical protein
MYGLLTEDVRQIKISGKAIDDRSEGVGSSYVELLFEDKSPLIPATKVRCDIDGNYEINTNLDNGKYYLSAYHTQMGYFTTYKEFNITPNKNNYEVDIELKGKSREEVIATNVHGLNFKIIVKNENNEDLTGYNLEIDTKLKNFYKNYIDEKNKQLLFLADGTEYYSMPVNQKQKLNKKEIIDIGMDEKNMLDNMIKGGNIKFSVSKKGYKTEKKDIDYETYNCTVRLNSEKTEDGEKYFTKYDSIETPITQLKDIIKVTFILKPSVLTIKVIDSKTKQPLSDVDIDEQTKNKKLKTNQNGEITLPDDYDFINLILRKQGYITKTEEFDISKNTGDIVVKLQSRTTENFSIGDEPLDKYKDTMFSIYGRGKTDINNKEAIRLAKVDAINKFIKKHKRVYGSIDIQNLDPDIEYELTYGRPLVKSEKIKEYKYILKFSKKDIKKYLTQFLEKEGIKIDKQPFEFEKMTLSEAIYDGYVGGKELMVVLGISNDDDTIELVNQLKNNGVDKKYLPIFVTVDRRSDDYNRIYELVKPNTYPKIIILKPTSTEKVKVINSDFKINQEEDEKI